MVRPLGFGSTHDIARPGRRRISARHGRTDRRGGAWPRLCQRGAIDTLAPRTITRLASGAQIVDFGQNFAGVVRIGLSGRRGSRVQLTHSELLTSAGEVDLTYLDSPLTMKVAPQRDEVILGGRDEWFQPWFTIHGFRYLQVDGLAPDLEVDEVQGVVLSSDLPVTGAFECSDERLNRLQRNVLWSLRSNLTDTPTDCPTRERSGWTGDIQVFAPTAALLVDAHGYLNRYLRNLAIEQFPDGTVPPFVPSETSTFSGGPSRLTRLTATAVGWGDAAVALPWTMYRYYGDTAVLKRRYDSMRRWVGHLERTARTKRSPTRWLRKRVGAKERYILDTGFHWGEWLRPGEPFTVLARDLLRHRPVVATAYFAHSTRMLSRIAEVIGADRQDDYVRALAFDLLTPRQRPAAVDRLARLIEQADHHIGTGFLSTPMIPPNMTHAWAAPATSSADVLIVFTPGIERFDYFRLGDRIRKGLADPVEILETQERFDNHFVDSPIWRQSSRDDDRDRLDTEARRSEFLAGEVLRVQPGAARGPVTDRG